MKRIELKSKMSILLILFVSSVTLFTQDIQSKDYVKISKEDVLSALPPSKKCRVIFFMREFLFRNLYPPYYIIDNEKPVEIIDNKSLCAYECDPGKHIFGVAAKIGFDYKFGFIIGELMPDKIYYIVVSQVARYDLILFPVYPGEPNGKWMKWPDMLSKKSIDAITITSEALQKINKKPKKLKRCYNADFRTWKRESHVEILPIYGQKKPIEVRHNQNRNEIDDEEL